MSIIFKKGFGYNAEFASIDFPVLTADWIGDVSLYTTYPGVATLSKTLVRVGNMLTLSLTVGEILNIADGVYSFVSTFSNSVLGVTITKLEYVTVLPVNLSASPMTKLFGTIEKSDGTPTGSATSTLTNTTTGVLLQTGWKGVDVKTLNTVADVDSGKIVGTETIGTQTNAAGYFELYVIQGLTVTVTCPSFGKSVVVDTTGLDTVDISTYF